VLANTVSFEPRFRIVGGRTRMFREGGGTGGMKNRTINRPQQRWLTLETREFCYCDLHFMFRYTFDAGFPLVRVFRVRRITDDSVSPVMRFNLHSVYTTAAADMPLVRSRPTTTVVDAVDTTSLSVGDFIFRTRFSKRIGPRGHRRWTDRRRHRHRLHRRAVHSSRRANSSGTKKLKIKIRKWN